jgi:purine nucleoside phosphorylase
MNPTTPSLAEKAQRNAALLREHFAASWREPAFFLQFGAGFVLEGLFDQPPCELPLHRLHGMPAGRTPDQEEPVLLYGFCQELPILVARAHRHLYEGHGVHPCILPTVSAITLGVMRHIYIDSALSLRNDIKVGSWTVLTDFINGHRQSPLDGQHELLSTPFPDMNQALSQLQNSEIVNALHAVGVDVRHCVFLSQPGSQFCTTAEAAVARHNGADLIGHDLVMEIIMAHAMGAMVSAFALAALQVPENTPSTLRRDAVLSTCEFASPDFIRGLRLAMPDIVKAHQDSHKAPPPLPEASADELLHRDFRRVREPRSPLRSRLIRKSDSE